MVWLETLLQNSSAWVGLTRSGTSNTFLLPSGSPPSGTISWCPSSPASGTGNCSIANNTCGSSQGARLQEVPCTDRRDAGVLCSVMYGCGTPLSRCVGDWSLVLHTEEYLTKSEAEAFCTSTYGSYASLAALDTSAQWAAALDMLDEVQQYGTAVYAWTGITRASPGATTWVLPSNAAPANLTWCPGEGCMCAH